MQIFPVGRVYNFMGARHLFMAISILMTVVAAVAVFIVPKPSLGTDFQGGTEIEVEFKKDTAAGDIRKAVTESGFSAPDVIRVSENNAKCRYLIRVQEVSTISAEKQREIAKTLCVGEGPVTADCPDVATELKVSPGGDKISVRYRETPDLHWIRERMATVHGIALREGENNPTLQN